jgi:hypothetical protein
MAEIIVPDHDELIVRALDFSEAAQINRSGWTATRKVIGLPGATLWRGQIEVRNIATELEERPWRAFKAKLRGVQNWFRVYLPCQSHIGPAPTVDTGAGNGYSLPLTGMTSSTTILWAGQHMTVPLPSGHARAVRLEADLITDAAGKADAVFSPALNETPALGATVETARPYVPVTASSPDNPFADNDGVSGFTMDIEEASGGD